MLDKYASTETLLRIHVRGHDFDSWAQKAKDVKIKVAFIWKVASKAVLSYAHAMTAQLSWHVQNGNQVGSFHQNQSKNA